MQQYQNYLLSVSTFEDKNYPMFKVWLELKWFDFFVMAFFFFLRVLASKNLASRDAMKELYEMNSNRFNFIRISFTLLWYDGVSFTIS